MTETVKAPVAVPAEVLVAMEGMTSVELTKFLSAMRAEVKARKEAMRTERSTKAAERKAAAAAKREAKIAKAKARLDALLAPKVGAKLAKANRKPSKATVVTGEAAAAAVA